MIRTKCLKCKHKVEPQNIVIVNGIYRGDCPECGSKMRFMNVPNKRHYDIKSSGQYIRKTAKMKMSKADKKRVIKERNQKK